MASFRKAGKAGTSDTRMLMVKKLSREVARTGELQNRWPPPPNLRLRRSEVS